jgi:photosystem II stability/assembly factor-like uncharacterized protein
LKNFSYLCGAALALAGCGHKAADPAPAAAVAAAAARTDVFQAAASNGKLAVAVGGAVAVVTELSGGAARRVALPGTAALIDVASCADGSFAALDFYRKVWTADAGAKTWKPHPLAGSWRPLALTCDLRNRLWVVGSDTTIAASADRGASWTQRDFKEDAMFNSIQFVDADHGFITGEFGKVYRTRDGGANWEAAPDIGADFYPYAALFTSPSEGYVAGLAGAMLRTTDGGDSWSALDNPGARPQYGLARVGGAIYSLGMGGSLQRLDSTRWVSLGYGQRAPGMLRAITPAGDGKLLIGGAMGVLAMVPADARADTAQQ